MNILLHNRYLVYEIACRYIQAGISVIPLKLDGSKGPAVSSWKPYQTRLANDDELIRWFKKPIAAIGIVCGFVSNDLEVFDFDDGSLFEPWRKMNPAIVEKLPVIGTPSNGYHVLIRCDHIGGNEKIAKDPRRTKATLIETRGEGGYIAAVGSHPSVHCLARPYLQATGPALPEIPRITPQERIELYKAARAFDRAGTKEAVIKKRLREASTGKGIAADASTPWGDFDLRADWRDILEPIGWHSSDDIHWTRPDKAFGTSAKICESNSGAEVLVVFSSNAGVLSPMAEDHATYGKFKAWCLLYHGGDYRQATKVAAGLGYGGTK